MSHELADRRHEDAAPLIWFGGGAAPVDRRRAAGTGGLEGFDGGVAGRDARARASDLDEATKAEDISGPERVSNASGAAGWVVVGRSATSVPLGRDGLGGLARRRRPGTGCWPGRTGRPLGRRLRRGAGRRARRRSSSAGVAASSEASPAVSSSTGRAVPSSRNGLNSPSPVRPSITSPASASRAARRRRSWAAARFAGAPVPAGISLPMMTFSLSPIRWSLAPLMAASVSTRVVSWKDAAARKLDVLSEALVTPEQDGLGRGRLAALGQDPVVGLLELEPIDQLGRQEVDVARLVDPDLPEHLPDDDLDVLVVDRDALAPVDLLDFLDQVALDGVLAPGVEVLLRVDRAVGDRVAGPDLLAALDLQLGVVRDDVLALDDVLGPDDDRVAVLDEEAVDRRRDLGRDRPCPRSGR